VFLAVGTVSNADIELDRSIFGTKVIVRISHSLPTPGVLKYLGLPDGLQLRTSAYSISVNGSSVVRNVNFAVDLVEYILEKFGLGDSVGNFVNKANEVLGKIL